MSTLKYSQSFEEFDEFGEEMHYWTDGKYVYYRIYQVKGADIKTFEHFFDHWAKDKNNCYKVSRRIKDADTNSFKVLNYSYAKDKDNVWSFSGKINGADAQTFEVCDEGKSSLAEGVEWLGEKAFLDKPFAPYGFGKDKDKVYYENCEGKPKIVKKANAATFKSLNDGYYGYDDKYVFCENVTIPTANPKTWIKLKKEYCYYSKDGNKIFYFNIIMKDADAATFEVVEMPWLHFQYAKDKNTAYDGRHKISFDELNKAIEQDTEGYKQFMELFK